MAELFASLAPTPLAERLRPKTIGDVLGQEHLLGPEGPLGRVLAARKLSSLILWGPPGCGKTTIARLLAEAVDLHFEPLSAVFSGVADLRRVFEGARQRRRDGKGTLLFVDEIHRFNRAQQDGFLPYVEDGTVTLVGATTENPSFDVNAALYWFSRMLDGGEDPKYIARRLVRFAVEDIGMADPNALTQTLAAWDTYDRLGSPEGELAIAQAVIYLGTAPKSNAGYTAFSAAKRAAKEHGSLTPPMHILNAPTRLMKDLGYAKGYEYDHNAR